MPREIPRNGVPKFIHMGDRTGNGNRLRSGIFRAEQPKFKGTIFSRGFTDIQICTVSEPHTAAYLPFQVAFAKNKTENQESHVFQMCV